MRATLQVLTQKTQLPPSGSRGTPHSGCDFLMRAGGHMDFCTGKEEENNFDQPHIISPFIPIRVLLHF